MFLHETEQKTASPVFTTTQQEQQTTFVTAPVEDPALSDIIKRFDPAVVRRIYETQQTKPNCGCIAGAMAVYSLLDNGEYLKERDGGIAEEIDKEIAEAIYSYADEIQISGMGDYVSSVGEMFDAQRLADTLTKYGNNLQSMGKKNQKHVDKKILAAVYSFDSIDKLKQALEQSGKNGIHILLPYFSGKDCYPSVPTNDDHNLGDDGHAVAREMCHAHWSIVGDYKKETDKISLYEGNMLLRGRNIPINDVFASNQSLGDTFEWNKGYLDNLEENDFSTRLSLAARWAEMFGDDIISVGDDGTDNTINEHVNLRGKIVLVGFAKKEAEA